MAITQALCTSFKQELFEGIHDFTPTTGDSFKMALYPSTATLSAATTAYSATGEVTGTGYTAGGKDLTEIAPTTDGTTAIVDFADVSWTSASFTAAGALIYNSSKSNRAVAVLDFGGDKTVSSGTLTIQFPAAAAATAIVRIA